MFDFYTYTVQQYWKAGKHFSGSMFMCCGPIMTVALQTYARKASVCIFIYAF